MRGEFKKLRLAARALLQQRACSRAVRYSLAAIIYLKQNGHRRELKF